MLFIKGLRAILDDLDRCEQILDQRDTTDPFTAELRSICTKLSRVHSTGNVYDEESQFHSYLRDQADAGASEENL